MNVGDLYLLYLFVTDKPITLAEFEQKIKDKEHDQELRNTLQNLIDTREVREDYSWEDQLNRARIVFKELLK